MISSGAHSMHDASWYITLDDAQNQPVIVLNQAAHIQENLANQYVLYKV